MNRWRGQVGLSPVDRGRAWPAASRRFETLGVEGDYVELVGPPIADSRKTILGVDARPPAADTWFVKLMGDSASSPLARKRSFEAFVEVAQARIAVPDSRAVRVNAGSCELSPLRRCPQSADVPAKPLTAVGSVSRRRASLDGADRRRIASLKLTVALFALGIFVVSRRHAGPDRGRHLASRPRLFPRLGDVGRCQPVLPQVVLPATMPHLRRCRAFPLPGGMIVGALMIAQPARRPRLAVQDSGDRRAADRRAWPSLRVGLVLTTLVILAGHNYQRLSAPSRRLAGDRCGRRAGLSGAAALRSAACALAMTGAAAATARDDDHCLDSLSSLVGHRAGCSSRWRSCSAVALTGRLHRRRSHAHRLAARAGRPGRHRAAGRLHPGFSTSAAASCCCTRALAC